MCVYPGVKRAKGCCVNETVAFRSSGPERENQRGSEKLFLVVVGRSLPVQTQVQAEEINIFYL